MDLRTQHYALDRGLDSMSLLEEKAPVSLPEQSTLVPPQLRYPAHLQQLLDKPGLSEFLANAFILTNGDAALSGPSQFAAALDDAQAELLALLGDVAAADALAPGVPASASTSRLASQNAAQKSLQRTKEGTKQTAPETTAQETAQGTEETRAKMTSEVKAKSKLKSKSNVRSKFGSEARSASAYDAIDESDADDAFDTEIDITPESAAGLQPVRSRPRWASGSKSASEGAVARDVEDSGNKGAAAEHAAQSAKPRPELSPRAQRLVQRAGRVLERESGLRADLASYRAALLKG